MTPEERACRVWPPRVEEVEYYGSTDQAVLNGIAEVIREAEGTAAYLARNATLASVEEKLKAAAEWYESYGSVDFLGSDVSESIKQLVKELRQ